MKRIVWLASYPKSGNTWMRLLLANYFSASEVGLNELALGTSAAGRRLFDEWSTVESSELADEEIAGSRGELFRTIAAHARSPVFLKTHEAWAVSSAGEAIFPADATLAVVYLVRHPYDVAVSMAHYLNVSLDTAVTLMGNETFTLRLPLGISSQLPEHVSSWHSHVSSWIEQSDLPQIVVRYEDLHADPIGKLNLVLQAIGESPDLTRLERAVELTAFDRLQQMESARGFRERWPAASSFFRGGRVGDGLGALSFEQRQTLTERHQRVMRLLGYLETIP